MTLCTDANLGLRQSRAELDRMDHTARCVVANFNTPYYLRNLA